MKQIDVDTWEEFEAEIKNLDSLRSAAAKDNDLSSSPFLYRGQRVAEWPLKTTMERRGLGGCSLADHFRLISIARPAIETFTNQSWDFPDYPTLREWASEYDNLKLTQFPGYDFLSYLRHHGFPSPLLDWSKSPYVAAYFAFAEAETESTERAAVYVYMEYSGHGKVGGSDRAQIVCFGPYVGSHPRHFLQQSQYTICAQYLEGKWHYASHEDVFAEGIESQDQLWRITIPASERTKALRQLDLYNLNAYSLFRTEESLLEMVANREIEFRDPDT